MRITMRGLRPTGVILVAVLVVALGAATVWGAGEPVKNPDTLVELQFGDISSLDPALAYDIYSYEPVWPK